MAYRFKLDEPVGEEFRRIWLEHIARALAEASRGSDQASAIHETRKCLKRIRSLLRLMRPVLGEPQFQEENAKYRDIAHSLSGSRDRQMLFEVVTKLEAHAGQKQKTALQAFRTLLGATAPKMVEEAGSVLLTAVAGRLAAEAKQVEKMEIAPPSIDGVLAGLERTYRQGRRANRKAYETTDEERFHELRKHVQQHWRQLLLLQEAWPEILIARVGVTKQLAAILGDEHDLFILLTFLDSEEVQPLGNDQIRVMRRISLKRQKELRTEAQPHAERLYAEGAKTFARRVAAYWAAAQRISHREE